MQLKTVTRTQGNNRALKEGTVAPRTFTFDFEEVPVLVHAFRRMVRGLEFDVCEMAFTTYLCAKEHGKAFTALPTFLVRDFHHGAILVNTKAGISTAKDLEGRKVGVNRGYTVTTGVWARSILQDEGGVDLGRVTWVLSGDEHVEEYRAPSNVVPVGPDQDIQEMLCTGELAAAVGVSVDHPDVEPMYPDPLRAGLDALTNRGVYPINHLVVVKDELLAAHPELAADTFDAFARSKQLYVDKLRAGDITEPTAADRTYAAVMETTGEDPLPYGIAPNRQVIEQLIEHALTQRILRRRPAVEELFAEGTRDLVA